MPLPCAIIQSVALKVAEHLKEIEFCASNGWLDRWKSRNGIAFKSIQGEKLSADLKAINEWKEDELCSIFSEFNKPQILI